MGQALLQGVQYLSFFYDLWGNDIAALIRKEGENMNMNPKVRTETLQIRLTVEEKRTMQSVAKHFDTTITDVLCRLVTKQNKAIQSK